MKTKIDKESSQKLQQYKQAAKEVSSKIQSNKKDEKSIVTGPAGLAKMAFAFGFVIILVISIIRSLSHYAQNAVELQAKAVIEENGESIPLPSPSQMPNDLNPSQNTLACTLPSTVPDIAKEAIKEQIKQANDYQIPIEATNDFGIPFRFIPKGKFLMGSPETEAKRNAVEFQHLATVQNAFYMSKFEITERQWKVIMGSQIIDGRGPNFPVVNISFNDAEEFTKRLNDKLQVPQGTYDLATETEWEYACRAWTTSPYFFGEDQDLVLRYDYSLENSGERMAIKGDTKPNPWGLYNMIGNAAEWTKSPFWLYECPDNYYAPSWDKAIYDGDKLDLDSDPLNNFHTELRTEGLQNDIYYADELQLGRGQYSEGEFIWRDNEGGKAGIYDFKFDTIIYNGGSNRDFSQVDGFEGSQNNLYYADSNKDKSWTEGEDLWLSDPTNRYASAEQVFRGGFWSIHVEGCRSAARYSIPQDSTSNFIGLRIIRRLNDIQVIEKTHNDSDTTQNTPRSQ